MVTEILVTGLTLLSETPSLAEKFGLLPNVNFPTMGGKFFWNDLANVNGWRVQKNTITGHCRILDNNNIRRAWGGDDAIMRLFEKILKESPGN